MQQGEAPPSHYGANGHFGHRQERAARGARTRVVYQRRGRSVRPNVTSRGACGNGTRCDRLPGRLRRFVNTAQRALVKIKEVRAAGAVMVLSVRTRVYLEKHLRLRHFLSTPRVNVLSWE